MKGRHEQALKNLSLLRQLPEDHPFVQNELLDVREQLEREREATLGSSRWGKLRELVMIPSNRYRFMLGIMSQLLGQWSGASAITIYAAQFFAALGKTGQSEKLFATCILGVVKLCSAYLCAFFLIDFFGRRRSLYTGICLQFAAIFYVALFLTIVPGEALKSGLLSDSQKRAATGAIAAIYISGFGWVSFFQFPLPLLFCQNDKSAHNIAQAMGWNSFQYLVNAEVYPIRLRALGSSLVMCFHFINQFGNTKAVPTMLLDMHTYGFFYFCTVVCALGLAWVWFFVPETRGKSLESMDALFSLPWHQIGRNGRELTKGIGSHADEEQWNENEKRNVEVQQVENNKA